MRHEDHDAHGAHVMTHSLSFAVVRPVVLKLVGGTEPHKFHTYIHRTLQSWKNIFFSSNSKPMYLIIITYYYYPFQSQCYIVVFFFLFAITSEPGN